jgi:hypothetical protein
LAFLPPNSRPLSLAYYYSSACRRFFLPHLSGVFLLYTSLLGLAFSLFFLPAPQIVGYIRSRIKCLEFAVFPAFLIVKAQFR